MVEISLINKELTCPSKYRLPNVLVYPAGDLDLEEIQRRENHKVLQEVEGDITVRDVCRKHQITEQTFYRWQSKCGSITVLRVLCLKELDILPFVNSYCGSVNPRL